MGDTSRKRGQPKIPANNYRELQGDGESSNLPTAVQAIYQVLFATPHFPSRVQTSDQHQIKLYRTYLFNGNAVYTNANYLAQYHKYSRINPHSS